MIRVLLVDDHELVREGLAQALASVPDLTIVGQASSVAGAIALARSTPFDVVVLDLSMPDGSGLEVARALCSGAVRPPAVLILSMHADRQYLDAAHRAGASGFVHKGAPLDELVEAIRTVASGGRSFITDPTSPGGALAHDPLSPIASLSPREREVLLLVAEGLHAKAIGDRLSISHKTVLAFRAKLMAKLGIDSVAGLTRFAIKHGLIHS